LAKNKLEIINFPIRGSWRNAKFEWTVFPTSKGIAQILKIVSQIHSNEAPMLGKKKIEIIIFPMRGSWGNANFELTDFSTKTSIA